MLSNTAMSFIFEKMSTGSGITFIMWFYDGASKSGKKEKAMTGTPGRCCLWHYTRPAWQLKLSVATSNKTRDFF